MPRPSTGEYPANWQEIAQQTKADAGWKCVRCGHVHDTEAGYMLTVHHIDLNKSNCEWWNLAALCQRCHLQIQHKVIIERPYMFEHSDWFKPYVAGYYAFKNNMPHDKVFVMQNLDQLLDFGRPIPFIQDELLQEAKKVSLEKGYVSPTHLQRMLRIGYTRAARLVDLLIDEGFCETKHLTEKIHYPIRVSILQK